MNHGIDNVFLYCRTFSINLEAKHMYQINIWNVPKDFCIHNQSVTKNKTLAPSTLQDANRNVMLYKLPEWLWDRSLLLHPDRDEKRCVQPLNPWTEFIFSEPSPRLKVIFPHPVGTGDQAVAWSHRQHLPPKAAALSRSADQQQWWVCDVWLTAQGKRTLVPFQEHWRNETSYF